MCLRLFYFFYAVDFPRSSPTPDRPRVYVGSSHSPGRLYKRRMWRAFKQSRSMRLTVSRWHRALL
uniref:Uncharacterized protein n=1 Tax=Human betaherpesvirus 6 TaxID=10368 RepID=A0A5P9U3T4_9BETA|nr:hypothetical protein [Human betaherpesvirus 6]QFW55173.1 hypothetical protein [Human betaherpesvirus 6]